MTLIVAHTGHEEQGLPETSVVLNGVGRFEFTQAQAPQALVSDAHFELGGHGLGLMQPWAQGVTVWFEAKKLTLPLDVQSHSALKFALSTHADLSGQASLAQVTQDLEGDRMGWRVLGATHGVARLAADGQSLTFVPEAGYAGTATITVQADDGYASSAPMQLLVNVSGAKLVNLRIERLAALAIGASAQLRVLGDLEDQFVQVPYAERQSNQSDVGRLLPPVQGPDGLVAPPNVSIDPTQAPRYDLDNKELVINLAGVGSPTPAPNPSETPKFGGELQLRAVFDNGDYRVVERLNAQDSAKAQAEGHLRIAQSKLKDLAIGSVRWQLVRVIPVDRNTPSGNTVVDGVREYEGNSFTLKPEAEMAAVLTRTGVQFLRQNHVAGEVALLNATGSSTLNDTYLRGSKVQPMIYSSDLSKLYIGGAGKVYVIDTVSQTLIQTLEVKASVGNISSLAVAGDLLIIGEGGMYGMGGRLLAINTNPASKVYHGGQKVGTKGEVIKGNDWLTLKGTGLEKSPYGVAGMTVGPDGRTLVVSVPNMTHRARAGQAGDVWVLDLDSLNRKTGQIDAPLVANQADYNHGLATLRIQRDPKSGKPLTARMDSIAMSQPDNKVWIDRTNVQSAQSAVLVRHEGVEYAIVGDDPNAFDDPYVQAMYEAPMFVSLTPFGPPTPIGGSTTAKKVAQGGKLGIVRDPFGKLGSPTYLGATLPLDGYGIVNLSLSEDGSVLLGQLKGSFGIDIMQSTQNPNLNQAWDVERLIKAALNQPEADRLRKHISLPAGTEQLVNVPTNSAGYVTAPAGTVFDPEPIYLDINGNMGDVFEVNVPELIARAMLKLPTKGELNASQKTQVQNYINSSLDMFTRAKNLDPELITNPSRNGFKLLTKDKDLVGGTGGATFDQTGVFYAIPNLTDTRKTADAGVDLKLQDLRSDLEKLRQGDRVTDKLSKLTFDFSIKKSDGTLDPGKLVLTLSATDAQHGVFFGDRPLDNPGYSTMTLSADANGKAITSLGLVDSVKLEHRLKYLGFGATPVAKDASGKEKAGTELVIDGHIDEKEAISFRFFDQITKGATEFKLTEVKQVSEPTKKNPNATKPVTVDLPTFQWSPSTESWLNAYNAPHWMGYEGSMTTRLTSWTNKVDNGQSSAGTSWVFDLMLAAQQNNQALDANDPLKRTVPLWFKGAGSLGTQLNLGINTDYVDPRNQAHVNGKEQVLGVISKKADGLTPNAAAYNAGVWNLANAKGLAGKLLNPTNDPDYIGGFDNASGNNMQDQALLDFLSVYSMTQKTGADAANPNGFLDKIDLKYATGGYKAGLFGDGDLIDSKKVLIGANSNFFGDQLTIDLLNKYMGTDVNPNWLQPLKEVMVRFGIDTQPRIAAFLGQIYAETGGFSKVSERLSGFPIGHFINDRDSIQGVFYNNKNNPADLAANPNMAGQLIDEIDINTGLIVYEREPDGVTLRRDGQGNPIPKKVSITRKHAAFLNLKAWLAAIGNSDLISVHFNPLTQSAVQQGGQALTESIRFSTIAMQTAFANRYLSHDVGTGLGKNDANGNSEANANGQYGETNPNNQPYQWYGRGLKQLTHKDNYLRFGRYLDQNMQGVIAPFQGMTFEQALGDNPNRLFDRTERGILTIDTSQLSSRGLQLMVASAAWFWSEERKLNSDADKLSFDGKDRNTVDAKGKPTSTFSLITQKINGEQIGSERRFEAYERMQMASMENGASRDGRSYESMVAALDRLGINAQGSAGYGDKFGISLAKRTPVGSVKLLQAEVPADNSRGFSILIDDMAKAMNAPIKDLTMYVDVLPPDAGAKIYIVEQAKVGLKAGAPAPNVMGVCDEFRSNHINVVWPIGNAVGYFRSFRKGPPMLYENKLGGMSRRSDAVIEISKAPSHGTLKLWREDRPEDYHYVSNKNYEGLDSFEFVVSLDGQTLKIIYSVKVFPEDANQNHVGYCKWPFSTWRISQSPEAVDPNFLPTWQTQSQLSALIASASQSLTGFAALSGTTLGLTQGEGASATITLDDNAAGYGWYVDPTPLDNTDDYLPTSLPEVWQAKPGSAAEGKMDLLSVLLHEYGHVLGLEHSDGGSGGGTDFMAANLQAGQRRLPTADELMRLQTLAAALLKPGSAADSEQNQASPLDSSGVFAMNSGNSWPSSPSSPLPPNDPSLPLGWSHSDALINLQRSMGLHTNAGAGTPVLQSRLANGVEATSHPDGGITYRLDLAALQGHTDGSVRVNVGTDGWWPSEGQGAGQAEWRSVSQALSICQSCSQALQSEAGMGRPMP